MKQSLALVALLSAASGLAEENRQLDAHEHGVGKLNIAVDGTTVAMEFHAPGADIVGFEYEAESEKDLAAIDAAIVTLSAPLDLFVMPAGAACSVTEAHAALESEEAHAGEGDHDDHDHDKEHDAHDDDDHAEHDHDGHDDEDDDTGHSDHDDHDGHDDDTEEAGHTEFHAEYSLTCANPGALTEITFAYFEAFENALEVEVQVITSAGAQAFEIERDNPTLDLNSLF